MVIAFQRQVHIVITITDVICGSFISTNDDRDIQIKHVNCDRKFMFLKLLVVKMSFMVLILERKQSRLQLVPMS